VINDLCLSKSSRFYGHAGILRRYAKLSKHTPFAAKLQHGWSNFPNPSDVAKGQLTLCWSRRYETLLKESFPDVEAQVIGAPFLYLCKTENVAQESPDRRGTVVFPCHSTGKIRVDTPFELYADQLLGLPPRFHPITVCMFHVDMALGRHKPFAERGFKIVTNGDDLLSDQFLKNCIDHLGSHKYCCSNQLTSALLYGKHLGCTPFLFGPPFTIESSGQADLTPKARKLYDESFRLMEEELKPILALPDDLCQHDHIPLIEEIGANSLLSPGEMKSLIMSLLEPRRIAVTITRKLVRRVSAVKFSNRQSGLE